MTTKERWEIASELARILNISKFEGFVLSGTLNEMGLLERILIEEDAEAIKEALALDWFAKKRKFHFKRFVPEKPKVHKPRKVEYNSESPFEAKANEIQVMIWAIKKVGSIDRAKVVFESAIKALE